MLKVVNFGAATCVIEGDGVRICCDPWITGTAYLGAWDREHYLPDPIAAIGNIDVLWISHIHEDHLNVESLRLLRKAHPHVPIWIGTHCRHLKRMLAEFNPIVQDHWTAKGIEAHSFASPHERSEGIDSYLVVCDDDSTVVDLNDLPFHDDAVECVRFLAKGSHLTALIPYSGAGPWPQCFEMSEDAMVIAAAEKQQRFLDQFERWRVALKADVAVPFSSGYELRGPLTALNKYRGIPRQEDVPNATVLPVIGVGERPDVPFDGYEWEHDPIPDDGELLALLRSAEERAPKVCGDPLEIKLWVRPLEFGFRIRASIGDGMVAPHETITIDPRLLHGLLTRRYHWNTAQVGSCLQIKRHGIAYDSRVFTYLNGFHI